MRKNDFLIVGQGLAGTMLAFEMLDRNMDFRIVSSPRKSKASLVAAGMINPLVFRRLTKSWMLEELLPIMHSRYAAIERLLDEKFYFEKKILKPLSEEETMLWKRKKQVPEFSSYIGDILKKAPVEGISPAFAYGTVEGAGYIDLERLLKKAELFFRQNGYLEYDDVQVDATNGNVFGAQLGEYAADKVIFCEGFHLQKNALFPFVKMNPAKGEVLLIHAPSLSESYLLNRRVFVLPVGNHRFKVGSTYEWNDLSDQPTAQGKASILERLDALIDVDYRIENHWAGVRPTIADRRPVLGRHPGFPNLHVFNGLGTKGVMLAPYFAQEMSNFLLDGNYELPSEVRLTRFGK